MKPISPSLDLYIQLNRILTENSRRFNGGLDGLGFNEFVILFHLAQAQDKSLRRIDLAEKMGLTASGITRILLPMEKIGLVKRQESARDARVSYTTITPSGERNLGETLEKAEQFSEKVFSAEKLKNNPNVLNAILS